MAEAAVEVLEVAAVAAVQEAVEAVEIVALVVVHEPYKAYGFAALGLHKFAYFVVAEPFLAGVDKTLELYKKLCLLNQIKVKYVAKAGLV